VGAYLASTGGEIDLLQVRAHVHPEVAVARGVSRPGDESG